jgi:hypothetical protein
MSALNNIGARLGKLSLACLTTTMIREVWNYFARNFICRTGCFADDKESLKVKI